MNVSNVNYDAGSDLNFAVFSADYGLTGFDPIKSSKWQIVSVAKTCGQNFFDAFFKKFMGSSKFPKKIRLRWRTFQKSF
jgi:hypothetical protein